MITVALSGHPRDRIRTGLHDRGYDREQIKSMLGYRLDRDLRWSVIWNAEVSETLWIDVLFCSRYARMRPTELVVWQLETNPTGLYDYTSLFNILLRGGDLPGQRHVDSQGCPQRAARHPRRPRIETRLRRLRL